MQVTEAAILEGRHVTGRVRFLSEERVSLRWPEVDLRRGTLTFHETKNGERRVVLLTGQALSLMHQHAKVRRLDTVPVFSKATETEGCGLHGNVMPHCLSP